jgi:hypothetical protein
MFSCLRWTGKIVFFSSRPGAVRGKWLYTHLRRKSGRGLSVLPSKTRYEPAEIHFLKGGIP